MKRNQSSIHYVHMTKLRINEKSIQNNSEGFLLRILYKMDSTLETNIKFLSFKQFTI